MLRHDVVPLDHRADRVEAVLVLSGFERNEWARASIRLVLPADELRHFELTVPRALVRQLHRLAVDGREEDDLLPGGHRHEAGHPQPRVGAAIRPVEP